jgi:hypothetical protein
MKRLSVENFGTEVQGIRLYGDPRIRPEPETVRVCFPGGDVDIVRTSDGEYWVHVRVDSEQDVREESAEYVGQVVDARLDIRGKHTQDADVGDLGHPWLYHLAVRVAHK